MANNWRNSLNGNENWQEILNNTNNEQALLEEIKRLITPLQVPCDKSTTTTSQDLPLRQALTGSGVEFVITVTGTTAQNFVIPEDIPGETDAQIAKRLQNICGLKAVGDKVILTTKLFNEYCPAGGILLDGRGTNITGGAQILFNEVVNTGIAGIAYVIVEATNITDGSETCSLTTKRNRSFKNA